MSHPMNAVNHLVQQIQGAAADPSEEDRDVSGAAALFSALLTQLAPHTPSPAAMARWRGMIPDEEARVDGVSVSSDRVIAAAMTEFAALVPHLLQEPLPGYGPRRAYYAVNLALEHAKAYASFLDVEARRAAASGLKGVNLSGARQQRIHLAGLLMEATAGDDALQAAVEKAARRGAKGIAEVSASLQGLSGVGRELLQRAAQDPGLLEALTDMGLTEAVVARAEDAARALGAARGAHDAERTSHRLESDELNTFDGRLWFELEALQRAAERARSEGRKVPAVLLSALARRRSGRGAGSGAGGGDGTGGAATPGAGG